ncbi:hypothetical protein IEQ34_021683 [Dendrobium chrysotoxum]|uniref:Uncharacterized protein n=1 Tax=Dendrobium chrysotoxum TaxID=161865 RepID=A0AAV7G3M3_DENCH|nr:hypothetical protein IEQ34_021683 [Dendrobium chrysotoxum]
MKGKCLDVYEMNSYPGYVASVFNHLGSALVLAHCICALQFSVEDADAYLYILTITASFETTFLLLSKAAS